MAQGFRIPNGSNWPLFRSSGSAFRFVKIVVSVDPIET